MSVLRLCFLFFRILGLWRSLGRLFCSAVGGFFVFGRLCSMFSGLEVVDFGRFVVGSTFSSAVWAFESLFFAALRHFLPPFCRFCGIKFVFVAVGRCGDDSGVLRLCLLGFDRR